MKKQGLIQIKTPAKINPVLRVLGQDGKGTHRVQMAIVAVSLYDAIAITMAGTGGVHLTVDSPEPLGGMRDNLVFRAARAFMDAAGLNTSVSNAGPRIHLTKHIPSGAGLGGGSGNAAGTLVALNTGFGHPLGADKLADVAAGLGADVPFFLNPVPSLAEGRGERLSALPEFHPLTLLVIKPPFAIPTGQAYGALTEFSPESTLPPLGSLAEMLAAMENQFEAPLFSRYPDLEEARAKLLAAGAAGALLSGSGSALFGVFEDPAAREAALARLELPPDWLRLPCHTLPGHVYL